MPTNTYPQYLTRGTSSNLANTSIEDGKIRFTTDEGKLYIDYGTGANAKRFEITDLVQGSTEAQILALQTPEDKLYLASDTNVFMYYDGSAWEYMVSKTPAMTYEEYTQLPASKESDGILRFITDMPSSEVDNAIIASNYNSATSYVKGDYCIHDNVLHVCTAATTGSWDSTKWSSTNTSNEIKAMKTDFNTIYTAVFDKDDWTSSVVSTDYPYEQTVALSGLDATGVYQAIVVPADGTAFLSDEEKKIYTNMVWNNNQLTAYASEEPTADITVQISKRI